MGVGRVGIWLVLFSCCFGHAQGFIYEPPKKPLATRYVECVRNDKGVDLASRKVRTPSIVSKRGDRAFAVVAADLDRGCSNTSMLYVAEPHSSFRLVFAQDVERNADSTISDGNGIEAILWSPSGKRLLAQVPQWTMASDADWDMKYILFSAGDWKAHEVPASDSIWSHFNRECAARLETEGWIDDDHVELIVKYLFSTDVEGEPDGTPSCVQKPMRFSFDVRTGISQPILNPAKH